MLHKKQLTNVHYSSYFDSMVTNDANVHVKFHQELSWKQAAFNKKRALSGAKLDLNLRKKLAMC